MRWYHISLHFCNIIFLIGKLNMRWKPTNLSFTKMTSRVIAVIFLKTRNVHPCIHVNMHMYTSNIHIYVCINVCTYTHMYMCAWYMHTYLHASPCMCAHNTSIPTIMSMKSSEVYSHSWFTGIKTPIHTCMPI